MKVVPKCLPNGDSEPLMPPQLSSRGWIYPCCWYDEAQGRGKNIECFGLNDPELKIDNVKNIEEIFYSDQWLNFLDALKHDQKKLPQICYEFCGR